MLRGFLCSFVFLFSCMLSSPGYAQAVTSPAKTPLWKVTKQKIFPFYKVQILTRNDSTPSVNTPMKAVIEDLQTHKTVEIKNISIEPDPRETVQDWVPGTLLDLDHDGYEDLLLRVFTGGAHCCYEYHVFSLAKILKKMGDLKFGDCGDKIQLKDLNGDGTMEIITCSAAFTYLKNIPYSNSPMPPDIFGLEGGKYIRQSSRYPAIFEQDLVAQKDSLKQNGYSDEGVIQVVVDQLILGRETQAWQDFEELYLSPNREERRQEIVDRWNQFRGLPAESRPKTESRPALLP